MNTFSLLSDPRVLLADTFALAAHAAVGQVRKYTLEPYIVHPRAVADIVMTSSGFTVDQVVTALLHDVVEDTKVPHELVTQVFGERVGRMVWFMTDPPTIKGGPNRDERKAMTRARFAEADGQTQTVKVADLIHNHHDIHEHDPDFAVVYNREALELLKVLALADPRLTEIAWTILTKR